MSVFPGSLLSGYLSTREVCDLQNRSYGDRLEEFHALRWFRLTEIVKEGDKGML